MSNHDAGRPTGRPATPPNGTLPPPPDAAPNPTWRLQRGTWEDAEALVGTELHTAVGVDPVNVADIRRRLEVLAWDSPIHYDEEAARAAGYDGIVSPATMVLTWCLPAYWSPGDQRPRLDDPVMIPYYPFPAIPGPGTALLAAGCRMRFHDSAYPGDVVTTRSVLQSVIRKRTHLGDGAFMVVTSEYRTTTGRLLVTEEMTIYRYSPEDATI